MPAWDNLDDFVDPADFAVPMTFMLDAGGSVTVNGIFDAPFLDAQAGEYNMETIQPRLTAKAADLARVRRGDTARLNGMTYDVLAIEPDGNGFAVASLSVAYA